MLKRPKIAESSRENLAEFLNCNFLKSFCFYGIAFFCCICLLTGSFTCLPKEDQDGLLELNSSLFLQYILARYFSAETGNEQLSWITFGNICLEENVSNFVRISVEELDRSTNLFPSSEMSDLYSQFCENISRCFPFDQKLNAFVANLLLFNLKQPSSAVRRFIETQKISSFFRDAGDLLKHELHNFELDDSTNFEPFIRTLVKMQVMFEKCKNKI